MWRIMRGGSRSETGCSNPHATHWFHRSAPELTQLFQRVREPALDGSHRTVHQPADLLLREVEVKGKDYDQTMLGRELSEALANNGVQFRVRERDLVRLAIGGDRRARADAERAYGFVAAD